MPLRCLAILIHSPLPNGPGEGDYALGEVRGGHIRVQSSWGCSWRQDDGHESAIVRIVHDVSELGSRVGEHDRGSSSSR
eukprot:657434-Alexandrium_andersonii.AAC.1